MPEAYEEGDKGMRHLEKEILEKVYRGLS